MAVRTRLTLEDLPPVLGVKHLEGYFGICNETARKMTYLPGFPVIRMPRAWRIQREAFLAWLAEQRTLDGGAYEADG